MDRARRHVCAFGSVNAMQHHIFPSMYQRPIPDMTFRGLCSRADEMVTIDDMATHFGTEDYREIIVFLRHEQDDLGEDYGYRLVAKEVIGVALCDVDDPYAMPEILDRDQAAELLGQGFVDNMESME